MTTELVIGFLGGNILESNLLIAVTNRTLNPNPGLVTQEVSRVLLKIASRGANWWRLPQPTATRRIEIKIYTTIDNLILIE